MQPASDELAPSSTQDSPTASAASSSNGRQSKSTSHSAVIIGVTVGGLAVVAGVVGLLVWRTRRSSVSENEGKDMAHPTDNSRGGGSGMTMVDQGLGSRSGKRQLLPLILGCIGVILAPS